MSIKRLVPKKGHFKQGYYEPDNPEKYVGELSTIIFRSGLERKFMYYLDRTDTIVRWSSEPLAIPYTHPITGKSRKYYPDIWCEIKKDHDELPRTYLVEIKPESQIIDPVLQGQRITEQKLQRYNDAQEEYAINRVKFAAAQDYCYHRGWDFLIVTEEFFKNRKNKKKYK